MTTTDISFDDPTLPPREIAERLLESTGRGLTEDRFDLFQTYFSIPTRIETFEASRDITTEAELRQLFENVRQYNASLGVTHLDRRCIEAAMSGSDRLSFTHETRLLSRSRLVQDPYPVFSDAVFSEGFWRIIRSSYAIVHEPRHAKALTGQGRESRYEG